MRVISKSRLRQFWEDPGHGDAEGPLRAWYTHVSNRGVTWRSWGDVRQEFGSASIVGNCVVFNIGGNKFRLVTRILYPSQKVFILKTMTHAEYDDDGWKTECGYFTPAPPKAGRGPKTKRGGNNGIQGRLPPERA
jgi:mRNA interferase HigB